MASSFVCFRLKTGEINLARNIVDVRDVATAHIQAAFTPSAHGRYIASTEYVVTPGLFARHLKAAIPRLHLTTQPDPEDSVYPKVMDNSRVRATPQRCFVFLTVLCNDPPRMFRCWFSVRSWPSSESRCETSSRRFATWHKR